MPKARDRTDAVIVRRLPIQPVASVRGRARILFTTVTRTDGVKGRAQRNRVFLRVSRDEQGTQGVNSSPRYWIWYGTVISMVLGG